MLVSRRLRAPIFTRAARLVPGASELRSEQHMACYDRTSAVQLGSLPRIPHTCIRFPGRLRRNRLSNTVCHGIRLETKAERMKVAALVGVALLTLDVAFRLWLVRQLGRDRQAVRKVWRSLYLSPLAWIGLIALTSSINPLAGGAVMAFWIVATAITVIVSFIRGVWRFPTAYRLLGEPEAWKGHRRAYWESAPTGTEDSKNSQPSLSD
jgi:hypothetical protein